MLTVHNVPLLVVGVFKFFPPYSIIPRLMQNACKIILYFVREYFPVVIHISLALFEFNANKIRLLSFAN